MADERRPLVLRWRTAVMNSAEPASTKLTLLALAEHASPAGNECYPGVDTLARQTSQGEKTCRRALDAAEGRWFTRTPIKFAGREWRGYSYQLTIPEGAVTVTGPRREVAVTVTGPQDTRCGHLVHEVRSNQSRAAVTVTDDLGKAPRNSTKEEKPASPPKGNRRKAKSGMTYDEWVEAKPEDTVLIPEGHEVFGYAKAVGIPHEYLHLAWECFCKRYQDDTKARYRDWGKHFRNAVEGNWYGLWWIDGDGQYQLTTKGKQADIFHGTEILGNRTSDAFSGAV